ncbi:amidase family protein, partial [Streptomyces dysideae]|uniref:amidase family protein n=1 Tax=Streptomyces dysideae TaxID=909626 RepID=UPI001F2EB149
SPGEPRQGSDGSRQDPGGPRQGSDGSWQNSGEPHHNLSDPRQSPTDPHHNPRSRRQAPGALPPNSRRPAPFPGGPAPHLATSLPPPTAIWSPNLGFGSPDPEIVAVAHAMAVRLGAAGVLRLVRPRSPLRLADPASAWLALRTPGADLSSAQRVRAANDDRLAGLFGGVDLLLTPTAPTAPHGHEGPGERYSTALTWAFNLSGHPAISIPAGLGPDGCPVGLQLVAAHGREGLLLDAALAAEASAGRGDQGDLGK